MKKLATVLGIMLVVVSVAAVHLWREIGSLHARNEEAAAHVAAAETARASGFSVVSTMQGSPGAVSAAAPPGSVAQGSIPANVPAGRQQSAVAGGNPLMEAVSQYENSSEGQEFARIRMRQMLEQEFPDLAKEMNLSPDKARKVLDLLARRRMEQSSNRSTATAAPQDRAAREELARAFAKRKQVYEGELSALLGSSYPNWPEYENKAEERQRNMYIRMGQEQLRDSINSSGAPLTDAQFRYFNTALEAEQKRIDQETTSLKQQIQRLPETNRRLIEVASAHLNPQQLERYRQYLQHQQETLHMIDGMDVTP